jgi:hypothetical protein
MLPPKPKFKVWNQMSFVLGKEKDLIKDRDWLTHVNVQDWNETS